MTGIGSPAYDAAVACLGEAVVLAAFAHQGAEIATAAAGVEILWAYIDPGVAGFVIVAILGFLSSIGYLARSYIGRVKRWLFGGSDADADPGTNREAGKDDGDDGKGERC